MAYDNTNRGVLFRNDRKEKDSHPDYSGSVNVEGVEFFFSGWIKVSGPNSKTPGSKFLSVSVSKKQNQPTKLQSGPFGKTYGDIDEDDVPF